jgi:glycogen phosphorylase
MDISLNALRKQYGCGPIPFSGTGNALYERHLVFDRVIDPRQADPHDRWEAAAHALRDLIAQRWVKTEETYAAKNPKRVYYLSMEYLLGRSLENNLTNALLSPLALESLKKTGVEWPALTEMESDAGLGNGGLGRLAACFIDSMATMQIPGMGYGLRYEYGIFKQAFRDGWHQPTPSRRRAGT